jgi:itaconate CoA-transferase
MTLPLDGVTVVTLEQAVAAPLATRNLADLGARVIKVERADKGDFARDYDHVVHGTGAHFTWLNRGKESLAVDLKTGEGRAVVRRLVQRADVFVQNLAPGPAERLGLSAAELRSHRPELIAASLSGYGTGGPMEQRKAYDMLIQAEAGLISITGTPDTPVKTGIPAADIASGMYCAQAVLAALLRRYRTGQGATIEVSMREATVEWMGYPLYTRLYAGIQPPRMGLSHASIAPYDAFSTRDGQVLIGVQNDSGWLTLVTDVLGAPDLAADPRFTTNIRRVQHRSECDATVAAQTKRWTSAELDADRQPPGRRAGVAGRADDERGGHGEAGAQQQGDREDVAGRAGASQQVAGHQALRRVSRRVRPSGKSAVFCTRAAGLASTAGTAAATMNASDVAANRNAAPAPSRDRSIAARTGIASQAVGFIAQARPSAAAAGTVRSG